MKYYIVGIFFTALAASCNTQRMICPAYQSAFIHDKATLDRHFSYFGEDSMPKIMEASKDKHLLIDPMTYKRKMRSLQTIAMEDIYPQEDDSVALNDDISQELLLAGQEARSKDLYDEADLLKEMPEGEEEVDAVASLQDSVYMISLKKEKFNIDQELYLWYLRKFLVYPDVKIQMETEAETRGESAPQQEKVGFFKKLFGGKKKNDLAQAEIDGEVTPGTEEEESTEKKGIFSFLKKGDKPPKEKKKKEKAVDPELEPDAPADNDEDDGEEDF